MLNPGETWNANVSHDTAAEEFFSSADTTRMIKTGAAVIRLILLNSPAV